MEIILTTLDNIIGMISIGTEQKLTLKSNKYLLRLISNISQAATGEKKSRHN